MLVSVDLPIPGEPPISTRLPGTSPPPRIRSNSPMFVFSRAYRSALTSCRRTGLAAARGELAAPGFAAARASSVIVFQALQPAHWPRHLADSAPQAEQTKT